MAGETEVLTPEVPEKIWSIDENKFVDTPKPAEKQEKSEVKEPDDKAKAESDKPENPKEKEKEKQEEEVEESDDKNPKEEEKEEQEEEDNVVTPDDYIASAYGEKFGVKTEADLHKLVENALDLVDEHDKLKAQITELEKAEPKFTNPEEKAAFDFIKKYGIPRQGEALLTYAKLIQMDVDSSDGKMILEEEYVMKHPEFTRDEAIKQFNRQYSRKMNPKKETFDSEADYNDEVESLKLEEKSEVARAKAYLKEQQGKLKPVVEDKPKVNEALQASIKKNADEYSDFVKAQKEVVFEHGKDKYSFKIGDKEQSEIEKAMEAWVKNPSSYDDKGQLIGVKNAAQMFKQVVGALYLDQVTQAISSQAKSLTEIKRVDELATKKPEKRSAPGDGKVVKGDDLYSGARKLIKEKA
jgi:hypothetical protein